MVNVKKAADIVAQLSMLKYFPSDKYAKAKLVQIVCEMATSEAQIQRLVDRMITLYDEWPGPAEMRACFCSFAKPADGIELYSQVYPDGIPSVKETQIQISGPKLRELPSGDVSEDDDWNQAIRGACKITKLKDGNEYKN